MRYLQRDIIIEGIDRPVRLWPEGGDFKIFGVEVADGNFDGFDRFTVRAPNGGRYILSMLIPDGSLLADEVPLSV